MDTAPVEMSLQRKIVAPEQVCLIEYTTCNGSMRIVSCTFRGEAWYLIVDAKDRRRQRWVRLFHPSALSALVRSYGYIGSDGCLNKDRAVVHRGEKKDATESVVLNRLSAVHRSVRGVPQRAINSGVCWYCAMCFVMLFSKQMRRLLRSKAPPPLRQKMQNVLTDKVRAEALRHELYHTYALGDRPGQDPALDGQNGFAQLCILLAHLDIPTVRLFAPDMRAVEDSVRDQRGRRHTLRSIPRADETSLLVVRAFRTKWKPRARITHGGRRYKLVAVMIGSEHCGHQIGASAVDMDMCSTWALSDSDATQHGVGPLYWSVRRAKGEDRTRFLRRWRSMWEDMVPATLFGDRQVCDLNPANRPTRELESYQRIVNDRPSAPGVVNSDFIFLHTP
tara:strand:- start:1058 stop:2233 length:1176 start_codon:yes stop_codon:yes gene_type:complete